MVDQDEAQKKMADDNTTLAACLRKACTSGRRGIKLPRGIKFTAQGPAVQMVLETASVQANMQSDAASFEGWSLALKRWLPAVTHVELVWQSDGDYDNPHYQRFLYRVKSFCSLFSDWFSIDTCGMRELTKLKTDEPGHEFYLNVPSSRRTTPPHSRCTTLRQAMTTEHRLECFIADNSDWFRKQFNIRSLHRQRPVGLFRDKVKAGPEHEVFPRRHSAIDLWGVDCEAGRLFLFELKKPGNCRMGILSEMFFYSQVMKDVQDGRFSLPERRGDIDSTETVAMYMLGPDWHPLIDHTLIRMVNDAFQVSSRSVRFGAVRITPKTTPPYDLELPAWDEM